MNQKNRRIVLSTFCKYLGVKYAESRIIIKENKRFEKNNQIFIYQLPTKSIVVTSPFFLTILKSKLDTKKKRITASKIKHNLGLHNPEIQDVYYFYYLNPNKFRPLPTLNHLLIRKLNYEDRHIFNQFLDSCSDADKQTGTVNLNDSVCFAGFHSKKIVTAATYSFWGEFLADIAVLTHPAYRKKGLGKAVLSALCSCGMSNNRISQYCCSQNNMASRNLAVSLKFEKLFKLERLFMKNPLCAI